MFGIGGFELFLILFGFMIFGPDKLPALAKTIGKAINKFRNAQDEMSSALKNQAFDKDSDEPFKNPLDLLDNAAQAMKQSGSSGSASSAGGTATGAAGVAAGAAASAVATGAAAAGTVAAASSDSAEAASSGSHTAPSGAGQTKQESFSGRKARYDRERVARKAAEKKAAEEAEQEQAAQASQAAAKKSAAVAATGTVAHKEIEEASDDLPAADQEARSTSTDGNGE